MPFPPTETKKAGNAGLLYCGISITEILEFLVALSDPPSDPFLPFLPFPAFLPFPPFLPFLPFLPFPPSPLPHVMRRDQPRVPGDEQ